jgi:arylsulfatase A-like enzyme
MRLLLWVSTAWLVTAAPAQARCGAQELPSLHAAIVTAAECVQQRLEQGPGVACQPGPAPACAGDSIDAVLDLLFGPNRDPAAAAGAQLADPLRCQRTIVGAGAAFFRARADEHLAGQRSHLVSQGRLEPIAAASCALPVGRDAAGMVLPALGGVCEGLPGPPGVPVAPEDLVACLRPALGRLVDDVVPSPMPPNIVVVMTDDQRWDTVQHMPIVTTRLAGEGTEFLHSFTTTSLCCPGRAGFFSGRLAHETGVRSNRPPVGGAPTFDESLSFVVALQQAGYATALYGKYMNATELLDHVPAGWNDWRVFVADGRNYFDYDLDVNGTVVHHGWAESDYSTDVLRDWAVEFVGDRAGEPFYLHYAPFAPHFGRNIWGVTPAPRHVGAFSALRWMRPPSFLEEDVSDKPPHFGQVSMEAWADAQVSLKVARYPVKQLESLLAVDEAVGALLDRLEVLGLTDHTLVVFTSDNGDLWGEHRLKAKNVPYEESIRVPLIVRYPLLRPTPLPATDSHLVLNLDAAPTFLELAGLDPPPGGDGRSLTALLDASAPVTPWRQEFLGEHWNVNPLARSPLSPSASHRLLRTARWKLVKYYHPPFAELYDLATDPHELENVASDPAHAATLASLTQTLVGIDGPANAPPMLLPMAGATVRELRTVRLLLVGEDPEFEGATISSPDLPRGATLTQVGPMAALFAWTPDEQQGGSAPGEWTPYRVTFRATDPGGAWAEQTLPIRVNDAGTPRCALDPVAFLVALVALRSRRPRDGLRSWAPSSSCRSTRCWGRG